MKQRVSRLRSQADFLLHDLLVIKRDLIAIQLSDPKQYRYYETEFVKLKKDINELLLNLYYKR